MFEEPPLYAHQNWPRATSSSNAPLLGWDVAHPLLAAKQQRHNDLQAFAQLKTRFDWQNELDLSARLLDNLTVIVTDRAARILWVSDSFRLLTGYENSEALGKTPAFLQGPLTSVRAQNTIRQKLSRAESVSTRLLNYRKQGTAYWCRVEIHPLVNSRDECTHFIAYEKELVA